MFFTLPKLYRGFGRAWKSLARSYFELFSPYFHQKQELDHPKWPLYRLYSTHRCIFDYIWCLWGVSQPPKSIQRSWKGMEISRDRIFWPISVIFQPWIQVRYNNRYLMKLPLQYSYIISYFIFTSWGGWLLQLRKMGYFTLSLFIYLFTLLSK